jgi:hypothetical protein
MHGHDYQIVRQIKGVGLALLGYSWRALENGLFYALFGLVMGLLTGLVTGIGVALVGVRKGSGFEWILISMAGIALGPALFLGSVGRTYWYFIIFPVVVGIMTSGLVTRMTSRRLGERLPANQLLLKSWGLYVAAIVLLAVITYSLVLVIALATRF